MRPKATLPAFYDDLDLSFAQAWDRLELGVRNGSSPFHTPTLATIGIDGAPQVRTVVLRDAAQAAGTLRIHTDRRSQKPEDVTRDPRCSLHAYDPAAKIQLRLQGTAELHHGDDVSERAWAGSHPTSQACYRQPDAPGTTLEGPQAPQPGHQLDLEAGKANFCVILIGLHRIEWLYLHHLGHRRAVWTRAGHYWIGKWLAP